MAQAPPNQGRPTAASDPIIRKEEPPPARSESPPETSPDEPDHQMPTLMNRGLVDQMVEIDPLPSIDRPIFEAPRPISTNIVTLHPQQASPHVEAAIEEARIRLGEFREFLRRFPHDVGGELGTLINHLRVALVAPKPVPGRDDERREEDRATAARRRAEDSISPPSREQLIRRAEEDAGRAELRRIQDTTP